MVAGHNHRTNYHLSTGGHRQAGIHSYLPPRPVSARKRAELFDQLRRVGFRLIRAQWAEAEPRPGSTTRNSASLNSRLAAWSLICRWGRQTAARSRQPFVPVFELGHSLGAHDLGCCRATFAACLDDLARWGLVVVQSGFKYQDTCIGLRLAAQLWPRLSRKILREQRKHLRKPLPGSDAEAPYGLLASALLRVDPVDLPEARRQLSPAQVAAQRAERTGRRQQTLPGADTARVTRCPRNRDTKDPNQTFSNIETLVFPGADEASPARAFFALARSPRGLLDAADALRTTPK